MTDITKLYYLTVDEVAPLLRDRDLSPVELLEAYFSRIEEVEPILNSYILVTKEHALLQAKNAESEIMRGHYKGPLHGVPFALKDVVSVAGLPNTAGCKVYSNAISTSDALIVRQFRDAGSVLIGKLNLSLLGYGPTGKNPDYGDMHNPWDPDRVAGGSSGGSASAIASGECGIALGCDTGGSIRIPAALCGVVGLKPTHGLLSMDGVINASRSMDNIGPLTRSVADAEIVMNAILGHTDVTDIHKSKQGAPSEKASTQPLQGTNIGVPREYFDVPMDDEVKQATLKALNDLESLGGNIIDVSWPLFTDSYPVSSIIAMAEMAEYHSKLIQSQPENIWLPTRLKLQAGLFFSGDIYLKAQQVRTRFVFESTKLMEKIDVLIGPASPIVACSLGTPMEPGFPHGRVTVGDISQDLIEALAQYTRVFNLLGFPAITIPSGFSRNNLPIGLQIAAKPYDEKTVFKVARAYETFTKWHSRKPPI